MSAIGRKELYLFVTCLVVVIMVAIASYEDYSTDPRIPAPDYPPEVSQAIYDHHDALIGRQKSCVDRVIRKYQDKALKYCIKNDIGRNIGGGCYHLTSFNAYHWGVVELAFKRCNITHNYGQ